MDRLYRFEFDESYVVNSLVVRATSFTDAYRQAFLVLGDMVLKTYLLSIHLIY